MNSESRFSHACGRYEAGLRRIKEEPVPEGQKYAPGTRVKTKHGCHATVESTYKHIYGPRVQNSDKLYSLNIDGIGKSAWHQERELTPL